MLIAATCRLVQVDVGLDAKLSWHGILGQFSKVELDQLRLLHHGSSPARAQTPGSSDSIARSTGGRIVSKRRAV